jgi:hypothetical protein
MLLTDTVSISNGLYVPIFDLLCSEGTSDNQSSE